MMPFPTFFAIWFGGAAALLALLWLLKVRDMRVWPAFLALIALCLAASMMATLNGWPFVNAHLGAEHTEAARLIGEWQGSWAMLYLLAGLLLRGAFGLCTGKAAIIPPASALLFHIGVGLGLSSYAASMVLIATNAPAPISALPMASIGALCVTISVALVAGIFALSLINKLLGKS